ncbi:MBL fold metallo-hydrolase [Thiohalorhabdus sp. Cl-TMA]|uniref:MBL fold metallo-hydrolase n=1 Tax=Thiohalorhabdus methylotrophus TaxID=3242694 RepID=A0ABV4TTF0_9GAMM
MQLRVLGCSGGVQHGAHTTSFLLDDDILVDAGSGVGELDLDSMAGIRHIFLSHSHLDHIGFLPLLIDTIFERIREPLVVHAREATLQALHEYIFNWVIWPDFTVLPTPERPVVRFEPMEPGEVRELEGRRVEMLPVRHVVPAAGFRLSDGASVLAFSGDCSTNEVLWDALNSGPRLDHLLVEAAFPNESTELAQQAGHYTPDLLAEDLRRLRHRPVIWITHRMPGEEERIFAECQRAIGDRDVRPLESGKVLPEG